MTAGLHPAYVLHTRRYSESSLIVEFFTRDYGRIATLAKGVLKNKRSSQNRLQPFVPLMIAFRGYGELPVLTSAEPASVVELPVGKILYCGMYVNELLMRMTGRQDPHNDLFVAYTQSLTRLSASDGTNEEIEPILRMFEVQLLAELGFALQLKQDQQGGEISAQFDYHYDVQEGPRRSMKCPSSISGGTLQAIAAGDFGVRQHRNEARRLMRQVISFHLDGQALKSRELFI